MKPGFPLTVSRHDFERGSTIDFTLLGESGSVVVGLTLEEAKELIHDVTRLLIRPVPDRSDDE